jgi:hypothetical protein
MTSCPAKLTSCPQCRHDVRFCECAGRCASGHLHATENDAIMCELSGPKED